MKAYNESRLTDLLIEFDEMGFCPTTVCPHPEQYAIEWKEQIVKEIQKLQAENAELRERLKKAVELPYAPDSVDVGFTQTVQSVRDDSVELRTPIYISVKKDTFEEASAMLKELEQNAAERDDNADAIIYGLRTVIGALKADKNSDER